MTKTKKLGLILIPAIIIVAAVTVIVNSIVIPANKYKEAEKLIKSEEYIRALPVLADIKDYKDSRDMLKKVWDNIAVRQTISAGNDCAVGICQDGSLVATGYNSKTMKGYDVSGWKDIVSVETGSGYIVGLRKDGTVVVEGDTKYIKGYEEWKDIVAISADRHLAGLKIDGTVVTAGENSNGECDVEKWENIIAISAGGSFTAGLKVDGTVVVAGGSGSLNFNPVEKWKDIVSISAGYDHVVGLKADGTVVSAGSNEVYQCHTAEWKNIISVSAGFGYTLGLEKSGKVVTTCDVRYQYSGKVTDWKDIVAISAGGSQELKFTGKEDSDYRIYRENYNQHSIGIEEDGTLHFAGNGGYEQFKDWGKIKVK